ncbi:MAG TPA: hypothetical protein VFY04_00040 [Solirubrobacterales bacterium]|nr:hypothetical protein [Solirubrobacterales bacterium]
MTGAPPTQAQTQQRSGWRSLLDDPAVRSIVAYTVVAMGALTAAYFTVFTVWAGYDDEGTLLVTLQAFVDGDALYRDVYSPYGPFYHEVFGGFFALTGIDVTNDASRSIVMVLWVATAFLFGIAAQRLTGRLAVGIVAMIAAFAPLYVLANEPMHPQVLCVLLLGIFVALAVYGPGRRPLWLGAAAGAAVGALLMTKLNLGVYAAAAVVLAAALTFEPLRRRRWLSWPLVGLVVAMPLVVVFRDLDIPANRDMVAAQVLAMAAVAIAAWPLGRPREERGSPLPTWLLGAAAGFGVAVVAILVAIVATGSPLSDVYHGMVTEAMRVREVNPGQLAMAPAVVDWAVVAVAGAALTVVFRDQRTESLSLLPALVRVVAALAIIFSITRVTPLSLSPAAGNQASLAAVLAWIAVVPPGGAVEGPYKRFLRVMLPALAVAEVLQVYPVPGSQVGIAALTFVPVAVLCLDDALTSARAWAAARGGFLPQRVGAVATAALVALASILAINTILRSIGNNAETYSNNFELPFEGASLLRVPEADAANYTRLVELLHEHRCTDFIGYPNVNSLYLWSGIEPPAPAAPGAWIEALDSERQARVVRQLRRSPRPCAIRNEGQAGAWLGGAPPPDRPLVNYVNQEFRPVETVGEVFEFMLPIRRGS